MHIPEYDNPVNILLIQYVLKYLCQTSKVLQHSCFFSDFYHLMVSPLIDSQGRSSPFTNSLFVLCME